MKSLVKKLKNNSGKKVVIIGDVMIDEYVFGSATRISPEAPVPVVKQDRCEWYLGGAANNAANCKHIGLDVALIGAINDVDIPGQRLVQLLRSCAISDAGIIRTGSRVTTSKKRVMAQNHHCLRVDDETVLPLGAQEFTLIKAAIDKHIGDACVVMISDYAKGVVTPQLMEYVITQARSCGVRIIVDPKGPDFAQYAGVDYIKPNKREFGQMVAAYGLDAQASMQDNARRLCQLMNIQGMLITLGEQGILFVSPDRVIHAPSCKREVFDLSGAGDTVFAFLGLGIAHGLDMQDILALANRAASIAISHLKTYAVSLDELVDRNEEPSEKIIHDWTRLKIELDWLAGQGKKIVFTNGCFDILHPGHVFLLKEAKKLGDILVLALNTDESVKRLGKGSERPINALADRSEVIAGLGAVDFVTSFPQDTPHEIITYLRPDVLVKGGDYKAEQIVGYQTLMAYGGAVKIIDFVPNKSTTSIIRRLQAEKSC